MTTTFLFVCQNIMIILVLQNAPVLMHLCKILFHRVQHREHLLTPVQATDPRGTITMVTESGRSFIIAIKTEDTAVQETNPATPGELSTAVTNHLTFQYQCAERVFHTNSIMHHLEVDF